MERMAEERGGFACRLVTECSGLLFMNYLANKHNKFTSTNLRRKAAQGLELQPLLPFLRSSVISNRLSMQR
jgi:hypothetical protein